MADSPGKEHEILLSERANKPLRRQSVGKVPLWLERTEIFVRIVLRLYVGIFVCLLPWTPYWTSNKLMLIFPSLAVFCSQGAVRGVISGLGILNMWVAMHEALSARRK